MIQYIMFNGRKYIPKSEVRKITGFSYLRRMDQNIPFKVIGHADGLSFCMTGKIRFYMIDERDALKLLLLS